MCSDFRSNGGSSSSSSSSYTSSSSSSSSSLMLVDLTPTFANSKLILAKAMPEFSDKIKAGELTIIGFQPWWRFRIFFIFFLLGEGEGGVRGAEGGGGHRPFGL